MSSMLRPLQSPIAELAMQEVELVDRVEQVARHGSAGDVEREDAKGFVLVDLGQQAERIVRVQVIRRQRVAERVHVPSAQLPDVRVVAAKELEIVGLYPVFGPHQRLRDALAEELIAAAQFHEAGIVGRQLAIGARGQRTRDERRWRIRRAASAIRRDDWLRSACSPVFSSSDEAARETALRKGNSHGRHGLARPSPCHRLVRG